MTVKGIDVASYQSAAYSTAGLGFVVVKATESTNYVNPKHDAQVAHGRANGLIVGHYHFVRAGSMSAQADYFLAHAKAAKGDFYSLDWEDSAVSSSSKDAWLAYVMAKQPGHQTLLYCNLSFWLNRDSSGKYGNGLWIADPSAPAGHPRIQTPYTIHQYGISGGLDVDLARFADKAAFKTWADKAPVVVPPVVPPVVTPTPTPKPGGPAVATQIVDIPLTGDIDAIDPATGERLQYRAGYYLAHQLHEARQQTALLVEIRDLLKAELPVPAQAQTEHAAALTKES
jgi:hypothetical protein